MVSQQYVSVSKTAHYQVIGQLTKKTKEIWIALHGYGQTADYMSQKMDVLHKEDRFIICLEALNHFYWHKDNKPVCTWMTSRHRYHAIQDNVQYLEQIYDLYCRHVHQDIKIVLFGFSQGCATLWRWLHAKQPRIDVFINWAGWIAEDIGYTHLQDYLDRIAIHLHYGGEDELIHADTLHKITDVSTQNGLSLRISRFDGKHHIPREELLRFVNEELLTLSANIESNDI